MGVATPASFQSLIVTNFYNPLGDVTLVLIYYLESKRGTRGFGLAPLVRGQGPGKDCTSASGDPV